MTGTSRFHGLRWVRVMAVFGSESVWQMDGTEGALDDLPAPKALRDRLDAWQATCDEHDDMDAAAPKLDEAVGALVGQHDLHREDAVRVRDGRGQRAAVVRHHHHLPGITAAVALVDAGPGGPEPPHGDRFAGPS